MVTFLGLNDHAFSATDAEVVAEILALADGTVSEDALAEWIRLHSPKRR
jgi:prophage maintenance system killer protein